KNDMKLLTLKDVEDKVSIFTNLSIGNPTYNSQTKEELTNKFTKNDLVITDKFLTELCDKDSLIYQSLVIFYEAKYLKEEKKLTDKLNKVIRGTISTKLIKASVNKDSEIWLFEGLSASSGFRNARALNQGCYLLRGKILNCWDLEKTQILENIEMRELYAILKLQFGKDTEKDLPFKFVIIGTDQDQDGVHIAGLILAMFARHFPWIIRKGYIYRALSPIITGMPKKGKELLNFYSQEEFNIWERNNKKEMSNYNFVYGKGLGSMTNDQYKVFLQQQRLIKFTMHDAKDMESIQLWFQKSTEARKVVMMSDSQIIYETE
ncbi:DNA topoisomerase 4 subunit B, partial [termite gut metagenome]